MRWVCKLDTRQPTFGLRQLALQWYGKPWIIARPQHKAKSVLFSVFELGQHRKRIGLAAAICRAIASLRVSRFAGRLQLTG